jgi:deoxyribonuclease-4
MADHPRFGPAGIPAAFRFVKTDLADVPRLLREEGLDAFEYEAVYWGKKPQMKKQEAEQLGLQARENDVWLSMHGSYFINLCGKKSIVKASEQRLVACAIAAEWMKAHVVVFHPGFYGDKSSGEAFDTCLKALKEVVATIQSLGIRCTKVGPETTGRERQLGTLDEILNLCQMVDQTQLVIDWSHLHARGRGGLTKVEDFRRVVEKIESQLGSEAARDMHCHFTKIEFSDKGERRHRTLEERRYGPEFETLARVISEFRLRPVIISESPLLDVDAIKMRNILQEEWTKIQYPHLCDTFF